MTIQSITSPTTPTLTQLRPLNLGDILDQTFRVFRKHFLLLMGIIAVISVPVAVLQGFGTWQYTQNFQQGISGRGADSSDPTAVFGSALTSSVPLLFTTLLSLIAGLFQTGALASAISELYLGRTITIGQAYRGVLRRVGSLLLLATLVAGLLFLVFVAVFSGAMLIASLAGPLGVVILCLLVPVSLAFLGVALATSTYWMFVSQAIVLEDCGAIAGLRRSWNLVRGSFWRVLGITLFIGLLVTFASSVPILMTQFSVSLAFPKSLAAQTVLNQVVAAVVTILLGPISAIARTLLYYDLRVRKEGFDLELMARQLAAATNANSNLHSL